ncbi:adenosine 3'-phospho 5'-phosphosulfate transporter 2 [Manduca sexta]|uniref:Adenosine 3'-phospho 5'-phosphosulfate transporter 2 n=1 Tax=Manduca sexta TaxID=7130 RepID=A0A921Z2Z7_MANSE|nr:adenosine 3'-phospho 5'-phosphosulfate transporter 2 [Manduca sexta]XP_037294664.1 adenosine 3'-phospho 5'-phosphosulfate transporter 2 [Manduca sexta]XP_037294665.1 adenosine 3'-phospho 5'-phosphosulfate transporter 2 [Manduca sexta]XP_037294666.1 adenosine 3'-phospho 5'-phosphosulfate transporter 2 [Manduca sexta]XP_037294667.1 adenosine 3'-phospho 5'-phosphosulfate transporter 2 [Manduca sexta]XP_037294668.1 adenosine 3'-phospho 5'-phosphosulfate transporter 2 [Manduca sexta]KAG6450556.
MASQKEILIKIDDSNIIKEQKAQINILCLDLTPFSRLTQFICCSVFVFVFYLAYGYFLELIFSKPEVKPVSLYITLVQFLMTMLLSYGEALIRNPIKRKVPLKTYALLAALTLGTMSFSNLALSYLNYPTQLIFKSCKLIPVMIGSIIILGKRYGFLDYVAAIVMCIGLTMFTLADSSTSPNFDFIGVVVISLALLCDAIIGNVQEKAMKQFQATNNEVVFYSYAIACVYLLLITGFSGILVDGYVHCSETPTTMYTNIFFLSLSGYMGLQAVLTLVRISGATVAVTVTTMRKALSIIISFLLFSKPFVFQYVWSGMLVVLAIYLNHYSKKHPKYVPLPFALCWRYMNNFYDSEYKYLRIKTKMYSNTV